MTPFELLFRDIKTNDIDNFALNSIKSKLSDIAYSSFSTFHQKKVKVNLNEGEIRALKHFCNQKDLIIQKADKGNTVVLLDKTAYIDKINSSILNDSSKFERLFIENGKDLNLIINSEKKLRGVFNKLKFDKIISENEFDKICPLGSRPGILYGLAKVHKPVINNCPSFRPILSAINTPTYKLAKFLVTILTPLTTNKLPN